MMKVNRNEKPMRVAGANLQVAVKGLLVNYTDLGPEDAELLLFVHGFPFNASMWQDQLDTFQQDYRVIACDVRGHGQSAPDTEPFSIPLFVNDLLGFMDTLKLDRAVLCGLSMGGYIAQHAVAASPSRFHALVLCDTTCSADSPQARENRLKTVEELEKDGTAAYAEASLTRLFAANSLRTKTAIVENIRKTILETSVQTLTQTLLALANRQDTCQALPNIRIPVLILVGEEDAITSPAAAHLMQQNIPGSQLQVIPDAGHLSNLENPGEFNAQLRSFLSRVFSQPLSN
ncbi:MAG: alpha/beta fold hydrolase [Bacteroidetes bacterium]|nr:alpha/beta fold hydrolase [Bacteroidota bacterium]